MSDIPINKIGNKIEAGSTGQSKAVNDENEGAFDAVISDAMNKVSQVQDDVDNAVNELATGGDITNAVLAIEKADMTFQLMVEVRNKLLDTYKEIMRMNV
jgi:flagellar hook-basal body complex protein FliE